MSATRAMSPARPWMGSGRSGCGAPVSCRSCRYHSPEPLGGDSGCAILLTQPSCVPQSWVELLPPSLPQSKHDQVQKKLESVEKQLEEAQQLVQLREMKISGSGGGRDVPPEAEHALGIQPDLWGHREEGRGLSPPSQCHSPAPGHSRVLCHPELLIQWELAVTARSHSSGSGMGLVVLCPRALLAPQGVSETRVE